MEFKERVYKLYRLSAKLNLYFSLCKIDYCRVEKELTDIEKLANELLHELKGDN